jgi:hypothetical protein
MVAFSRPPCPRPLRPDGHVQDRVDIVCADDETAKEKAKQLVDGYDVELWQLDRQIAEFKRRIKAAQG